MIRLNTVINAKKKINTHKNYIKVRDHDHFAGIYIEVRHTQFVT